MPTDRGTTSGRRPHTETCVSKLRAVSSYHEGTQADWLGVSTGHRVQVSVSLRTPEKDPGPHRLLLSCMSVHTAGASNVNCTVATVSLLLPVHRPVVYLVSPHSHHYSCSINVQGSANTCVFKQHCRHN
jgi:hypothetical protein